MRPSTASSRGAVERWQRIGLRVEVIDPLALASEPPAAATVTASGPAVAPAVAAAVERADDATVARSRRQMVALLFSDTLGYSHLTEEQIPAYIEHFLGGLAGVLAGYTDGRLMVDTWSDAVHVVFTSIAEAGRLALADWIERRRWADLELPAELRLRIALHAGPAFSFVDPLICKRTFSGSRAARLEPVTPPGQVYASEAFATLAAAEGVTDFSCEYVGIMARAKGHGELATHHLRRRPPSPTWTGSLA